MAEFIQLLAVENVTNRKTHPSQQSLFFLILVANLGYDKQVNVVWSDQSGNWQALAAEFVAVRGDGQEYWQAEITQPSKAHHPLPGNICFALRFRCMGQEYWDNNHGNNYSSRMGSGLELAKTVNLQNLFLSGRLHEGQKSVPIKIAVNSELAVNGVFIHWTTDNWRHTHQASCRINKHTLHAKTHIWQTRVKVGDAFRLQYAIRCKNRTQQFWDDNYGKNFLVSHEALKIMILNLHCYQEEHQDRKFTQIAKAIDEQAVNVVCFQEVAEHWNHGHGDWPSNSALIINQRLRKPFHIYSDWSHIGFDKYREGVAILSRYPLLDRQSGYVSDSHDIYSIHSRKVVMARIDAPYLGKINVFSAHLSWWEDGFQQQFQRLTGWAERLSTPEVKTTLLCGDFNITAGTTGYWLVVNTNRYEDQYLAANAKGLFEKIFRVNDSHWQDYPADDYRIDYIFMNKESDLCVKTARVLFTESDYGRVSDHCGYLMTFEPK